MSAHQSPLIRDGDLLWTPGPDRVDGPTSPRSPVARPRARPQLRGYDALWRWSVTDLEGFWQAVWDYFGIDASAPPTAVLGRRTMPGAEWFPGARLNYAQHVLRREQPGEDALYYQSESTPLAGLAWPDLANSVRVLATRLRAMGVRPGDRVASCMPNIPQTVIAMLATTSIGAVWTSCSPTSAGAGSATGSGSCRRRCCSAWTATGTAAGTTTAAPRWSRSSRGCPAWSR